MSAIATGLPDLLQRFVPTPYSAVVALFNAQISFQCNDQALITSLERAGAIDRGATSLVARVVRDYAAPTSGSDITVISMWPVATIMVGAGTVLAVDMERREMFAFIASSVSAEQFINSLLPIALEAVRCSTANNADVHWL